MSILDHIVADTRELVERRKRDVTLRSLEAERYFDRPCISFSDALHRRDLAFIAEAKQASPSKGSIRPAYDVVEIARQYEGAGAAAMSVLTEPAYFKGSLEDLAAARQVVDIPLLRKDFIIDPYQLYEAKAYGADAVLLIAAVLDRVRLAELHDAATELGLACLVEVYEFGELAKIDFDRVDILGVNNRDLRTFEVDVNHSLRIFAQVPENVVRVSESGLRTGRDLAHLKRNGVDAVLIGEAFMSAPRPGEALAALRADMEIELRRHTAAPAGFEVGNQAGGTE